jgi:hypothetical protein
MTMQWGHLPLAGDAQRDEVGARPLAATRLGGPPPACGGEPRNHLQRTTLTPPSTGITAPVI